MLIKGGEKQTFGIAMLRQVGSVASLAGMAETKEADMSENEAVQVGAKGTAARQQNVGGRSGIDFPYSGLDDAVKLAVSIYENHGSECDLAQLAGWLGSTVTSSKFRSQVSAAKMFGLIHRRTGVAALTELGLAIVDPAKREEAKVEAFLSVPLYRQLHDKFAGRLLPPDAGLEAEIRELGVTIKSVPRARQTFQRSAAVAGFFKMGRNRLVRPPVDGATGSSARDDAADESHEPQTAGTPSAPGPNDDLLSALWARLPIEGAFPEPQRSHWLKMLRLALDMVYGTIPEEVNESEQYEGGEPF